MDFELHGIPAVIAIFIVMAIPISLVAAVVAKISAKKKRMKLMDATVIAEYDPPEGLSPAEMGYLFDSRVGGDEIAATILDLEQRGILILAQGSGLGGSITVARAKNANTSSLKTHERYVYDSLAEPSGYTMLAAKLRLGFASHVRSLLTEKGLVKKPAEQILYTIRRVVISYLLVVTFVVILPTLSTKESILMKLIVTILVLIFAFPFFFGLALVVLTVYGKIVGHPGIWTKKLKELWPKLEGYKQYIELVELDKVKFEASVNVAGTKNKALPYAVGLGMNTDWKQRFGA